MPDAERLQSQFYLTLGGAPAPPELMSDLERIVVDSSLHMPDMATLVLHDPRLSWIDDERIAPGVAVTISASVSAAEAPLFDGEIVELESEFGASQRVTVRAFDRLHRLARGRKVRTFVNVGDDDLMQRIAAEVGLSAVVRPPPRDLHAYILQANETNLAFLQRRAAALGALLYVEGSKLCCVVPDAGQETIDIAWGDGLYEFRPRMTTVDQVSKVIVRGWSPNGKHAVMGEASRSAAAPRVGGGADGGAVAEKAFHLGAEDLVADRPVRSQDAADMLAQAIADKHGGRFIEAEGVCAGLPQLTAGKALTIANVGRRFSGTYFVTSAAHVFDKREGYRTTFSISGQNPLTLLGLLAPPAVPPTSGLVIGLVTDNDDPESQGRVKVLFPWLSPDHTSDWARVVSAGGGAGRGIQFIPEVGDEVLVGFEMGDVQHPYVLGGLWNGVDAPPCGTQAAVRSGAVQQRLIVSRTGHAITLNDAAAGGITIEDAKGNRIVLDSGANSLSIESKGALSVVAQGDLTLEAKGGLSLKGRQIAIDGQATVNIKGGMINLN